MNRSPFKRLLPAIPLLLPFLNACGPVTFPAGRLPEAVREVCQKEQKIDVDARLVGKTLYLSCSLEGLIGTDLDFRKEALEKLEGVMLSGTRAALSTDAEVDFLEVRVKDARLGTTISLLRYVPDIKGLIYMRYSRADFEDRLCLETNGVEDTPEGRLHDVSLPEYMARLIASQLHRQVTGNPLVSVFARVNRVMGSVEEGTLVLSLERSERDPLSESIVRVIRTAVDEVTTEVLKKYDPGNLFIQRIRLEQSHGPLLWESVVH